MILRRVIAHFRKQEWTAIFLDFLIVVAGVFVATQVSNWNAAIAARRQGEIFSERLKADLRFEARDSDVLVAYMRVVQANADRALAILEGSAEATNEELLIHAFRATQYTDNSRRRSTFDELTSTGSIGLIADASLRDIATLHYTSNNFANLTEEGVNSRYRAAFRMIMPLPVQDALTLQCGDRFAEVDEFGAIRNNLDYDCATGLPAPAINAAAQLLRAGPEIIPLLRLRAANVRSQITNMTDGSRDILDGLHAIAKETP